MKIAFIGLGKMGIEMANNLLRAGHHLSVYNRTTEKASTLEALGARVAVTPAEAVADAEAVLTILTDDDAVEAVTFDRQGIMESLPSKATHVGMSTISVGLARRLDGEHRRRGQEYVAAPVLGRPEAARYAKLIMIAAGPADCLSKVQPIFEKLGRTTFTVGVEPWQANLFKLCSNFMISSMIETFGEAQALVRKAGFEAADFVELMTEFWGSVIYQNYGSLIADGRYDPPGVTLTIGLKDNRLLLDAARELSVPLPVASLVRDQMLSAMAAGNAELDWASLTDTAIKNAGLAATRR
jgi:3-hydroxyisobutyrate dehydrogenase-like beta-hydroxyacid dehydrogenase